MGTLNCPRHFFLLGCGMVAFVCLTRLPISLGYDRSWCLFGLSGALHATAMALALRSSPPWWSRLAFVAAAAVLSITALVTGLGAVDLLGLRGITTVFVALALIAAIGAASYWLLVRAWWARSLSFRSLLAADASCVRCPR
jgi:hypothetical protein